MFFRAGWELEVEVLAPCRSTSIILKIYDFFCDGHFFKLPQIVKIEAKLGRRSADNQKMLKIKIFWFYIV